MIFGKKKTSSQQSAGCPPQEAFPPQMTKAESDVSSHQEEEEDELPSQQPETPQQQQQPTATATTSCSMVENEYHPLATHDDNDDNNNTCNERFQRGDHVYQWCSLLGIPGVFQHHGIVIHVQDMVQVDSNGEETIQQLLTIADFSNLLWATTTPTSSNSHTSNSDDAPEEPSIDDSDRMVDDEDNEVVKSFAEQANAALPNNNNNNNNHQVRPSASGSMPVFFRSDSAAASKTAVLPLSKQGWLRVYTTTSSNEYKWHKVKYQDHWFHTHIWKRSGTCTPAKSDPPEVVLKRVNFLLSCRNESLLLPKYHAIYANCECVSVWCKTGTWSTLQAASFLSHAAVGQVKGTAAIAGMAAAQTVTVPAAGVWGWLGYTTTVPLMTVNPLVFPAICAYGAVTIGGPAVCLAMAKSKWKETTKKLNEALEAECLEVSLVT